MIGGGSDGGGGGGEGGGGGGSDETTRAAAAGRAHHRPSTAGTAGWPRWAGDARVQYGGAARGVLCVECTECGTHV